MAYLPLDECLVRRGRRPLVGIVSMGTMVVTMVT